MFRSLVIGSSKGIGKAITYKLLTEGHSVIGVSRSKQELNNINFTHYQVDITKEILFHKFLSEINLDEIDNFILSAGTNDIALMKDITINRLEKLYRLNIYPAFNLLSKISTLKKEKTKAIVFITSIWSSTGIKGRAMYGSSKAALVSLSKHASAELSQDSIFINCLSPGFTKTELSEKTQNDPLIKNALSRTSIKKMQETNSISESIMMLLVPHNKSITGQEIFVDSGFSAHA